MADNGHFANMASSPTSSEGESNYRTPGTKASALTSGDGRATASIMLSGATGINTDSPVLDKGLGRAKLQASIMLASGGEVDASGHLATVGGLTDPFITGSAVTANGATTNKGKAPAKAPQKLSATAISFTPSSSGLGYNNDTHDGTSLDLIDMASPGNIGVNNNKNNHVLANPCVVNGSTSVTSVKPAGAGHGPGAVAMSAAVAGSAVGSAIVGIIVLNYRPEMMMADSAIIRLFGALAEAERRSANPPDFVLDRSVPGQLRVKFYELHMLDQLVYFIRRHYPEWVAGDFEVSPKLRFSVTAPGNPTLVYLTITYEGPVNSFDADALDACIHDVFKTFGELLDWQRIHQDNPTSIGIIARYREAAAASIVVHSLNLIQVNDIEPYLASCWHGMNSLTYVRMVHFRRGPMNAVAMPNESQLRAAFNDITTNMGRASIGPKAPLAIAGGMGPLPSGAFVEAPIVSPGVIGQERFGFAMPQPDVPRSVSIPRPVTGANVRRAGDHGPGHHHNVVDTERIRHGLDVRTTIMLRNIPNKIDQPMLKSIVDETSHGKYDFMYLRIDFANNCNVGYAFINFEDPYYIIDFVRARAGYRWNCFNSDKVAEVSYATIQGKDCLVQKFRNSSVMLEIPAFRPKVFYTGTGPLAGTEEPFPGPDNNSKMRRSIENAAHVGLFAPGGGQNPRHDQRRRRSQFDRGTRLAQMEEANGYVHPNMGSLALFPVAPHHPVAPTTSAQLDTHQDNTTEEHVQQEANGFGAHPMGSQQHH